MEAILTYEAADNLVRAVLTGPFSITKAKSTFLTIRDAAYRHKAQKVLVDGRLVIGEPEPIERFEYGEFVAEAAADLKHQESLGAPQFAYVLEEPVLDRLRLGETVAINRGMNVKAFSDIQEAERWLGLGRLH